MRGEKSRFLVGCVLLIFASIGAILTLNNRSPHSADEALGQNYTEVSCGSVLSYLKPSPLYNVEKRGASPRAVAYDLILSSGERVRALFDFSSSVTSANIKVKITNSMDHLIDLGNTNLLIEVDTVKTNQTISELKLDSAEAKFVEFEIDLTEVKSASPKTKFSILNSGCVAEIPEFAKITKEDRQGGFVSGVTDNDESSIVTFKPGLSYLGFSDARLIKNIERQGIAVYSYDGAKKVWDRASVIKPGLGYAAYNAGSKPKKVIFDSPFQSEINNQGNAVRLGWNLMYNNFARDVEYAQYMVSFFDSDTQSQLYDSSPLSLATLMKDNLVSDQVYVLRNGLLVRNESAAIQDADVFWVYVYDYPKKIELKPLGLDFKLEGVGDTYQAGQNVNLSFMVVNLDGTSHNVVAPGIVDPCSYGIKVTDQGGKVIRNDMLGRACLNWPTMTPLQSNAKINYNYTWKIPSDTLGKYKIEAYFDNYRGVLGIPAVKESLINVK